MNSSSPKPDQLSIMRHSCAHVLAAAVQKLYPNTKFAIGPAIDNGFYYDFDFDKPLSENDLVKIEAKMAKIVKEDIPFEKKDLTILKAKKLFTKQAYKQELIADLAKKGQKTVSVYLSGDFIDLCSGPHVSSTGKIGPFKLLSLAGAYWQGNENKPQLTRVYGTCFTNQKDLDQYLFQIEEAKKRDHRLIGKKLDLFSFHPGAAPGDVFWHPKGYSLMKKLIDYWREEHEKAGYQEVRTPEILKNSVWEKSGHLQSFADKMYRVATPDSHDWNMSIKPMNCDGGILIYQNSSHSYRELPLRMGELGVVHRYETSGELHGIIRPREFTQDDAHIFCTKEQVKEEIKAVMSLCFKFYQKFELELDHLELSTRPKNSIGSDEIWQEAEKVMEETLRESGVEYKINKGDGAFYGPKIDFHLKDSLERTWQCSTIQLDFAQPENFNLYYVNESGEKVRPVMIHRVIYGSLERFLGILIEGNGGNFPFWLAPTQVMIIPITNQQTAYAQKIRSTLIKTYNIRTEVNGGNETTSKKIRQAEEQKIPYMLIVGAREEEGKTVNVRERGEQVLGEMKLEKFLESVGTEQAPLVQKRMG
ncbi:MAG: threonine--tRNA ligase [Candidatus Shapirobacteria bacterium]|nr:threonine--tRNA ligase [Candidatus Shapirobacteria bacterium]MDD5481653.1 threonine--tRNA ligase [Candidatus Shapirobacteria bacterium]